VAELVTADVDDPAVLDSEDALRVVVLPVARYERVQAVEVLAVEEADGLALFRRASAAARGGDHSGCRHDDRRASHLLNPRSHPSVAFLSAWRNPSLGRPHGRLGVRSAYSSPQASSPRRRTVTER